MYRKQLLDRWLSRAHTGTAYDEARRIPPPRASHEGSRDRSPPVSPSDRSRLIPRAGSGIFAVPGLGCAAWQGDQSSSKRPSTGSPRRPPTRTSPARPRRSPPTRWRASTPAPPSCTTTSTCSATPASVADDATWRPGSPVFEARPDALIYPTVNAGPDGARPSTTSHLLADRGSCGSSLCDPGSVNLGGVDERGVPEGVSSTPTASTPSPPSSPRPPQIVSAPASPSTSPGSCGPPSPTGGRARLPPGHDDQVLPLHRPRLHGRAVRAARPPCLALDAYLEVLGDCPVPWAVSVVGGDVVGPGWPSTPSRRAATSTSGSSSSPATARRQRRAHRRGRRGVRPPRRRRGRHRRDRRDPGSASPLTRARRRSCWASRGPSTGTRSSGCPATPPAGP